MNCKKVKMICFVVMMLAMSVLLSCSKSSSVDEDGFKNLGTVTVSREGALIEEDALQVQIESETFLEDTQITISKSTEDRSLGDNQASDTYQLAGITSDFSKPITIRLKPDTELQGETYISVGVDAYVKSLNEYVESYTYLETVVDEEGYVKAELKPTDGKNTIDNIVSWIKSKLLTFSYAGDPKPPNTYGPYKITVTTDKQTIISEGKFKLIADRDVSTEDMTAFMTVLEENYAYYNGLGLGPLIESDWPLEVIIRDLWYGNESGMAHMYPGMDSWIVVNKAELSNVTEMKITMAHELLHIFQRGYGNGYWLDEATATWVEIMASGNPKYVPQNYTAYGRYNNYILDGPMQYHLSGPVAATEEIVIEAVDGEVSSFTEHGYAMLPIIEYMVDKHGSVVLSQLYSEIADGKSAMEAINSVEDMELWAYDYYKRLISGETPLSNTGHFRQNDDANEELTIPSKKLFEENEINNKITQAGVLYEVLNNPYSANVFSIKWKMPRNYKDIDNSSILKFECSNRPDSMQMFATVYKKKDRKTDVLEASEGIITIPLKEILINNNGNAIMEEIMIVAVNHTTEVQSATIDVTLVKDAPPLGELVGIWSDGTFTFTDVQIDPEVEKAVREDDDSFFEKFEKDEDVGCDAQILVAFKDMIGEKQTASFEIKAKDETNGTFTFVSLLNQEQKDPRPIEFTYNSGELYGVQSSEGITNTLKLTASYNDTKTKVLLKGTLLCKMPVTGMKTLGSFTAELDFNKNYVPSPTP